MKILLSSYAYKPSIGGIESVSALLVDGLRELGHEVRILTETVGENDDPAVIRRPTFFRLLKERLWADAYLQSNLSLRHLLPCLLVSSRCVVVSHVWIGEPGVSRTIRQTVKRLFLGLPGLRHYAVSRSLAFNLPKSKGILPNPYQANIFSMADALERREGFIFVGRLVKEKGCELLIQAVNLQREALACTLVTIVGDGPERENLASLVESLDLSHLIRFKGSVRGQPLSVLLQTAKILVVPSIWSEPFGVVVLEGLACGASVLAADAPGLMEAGGSHAWYFSRGSASELGMEMVKRLREPLPSNEAHKERVEEYLKDFTPRGVSIKYERALKLS